MKNFTQIFTDLAQAKQFKRYHAVQRAILIGMKVGHDQLIIANSILHQAFSPITRKQKLDNGRLPFDTLIVALAEAKYDIMRFFDNDEEVKEYLGILNELLVKHSYVKSAEFANRKYVYIFVRQDMSPEYQLVQAAHAAAKMGHRQGDLVHKGDEKLVTQRFDELYFAVIGVPDIAGLAVAMGDAKEVGATVYPFYEPDVGNLLTAFATSPIYASDRKRLLSYKKLRF
jgi:hypothetical protein